MARLTKKARTSGPWARAVMGVVGQIGAEHREFDELVGIAEVVADRALRQAGLVGNGAHRASRYAGPGGTR